MKMKTILALLFATCVAVPLAEAQNWSGGDVPANLDWSDNNNWVGGAAPTSSGAVLFPDGVYPISTNAQGLVNNIVQGNTTIASLTYQNLASSSHYNTTEIPSGMTLTVSGSLIAGLNSGSSTYSIVTITNVGAPGGSLIVGSGAAGNVLTIQNSGSSGSTPSLLDLSGLSSFTFNGGSVGVVNLGAGSGGGNGDFGTLTLAAGSNNITGATLYMGYNNTRGNTILNLGNGTNNLFVDTINMAFSKTTGTMQFFNNVGGGLKIASHTGTGRANINLSGQQNTGGFSAANTASMLFNGGNVNILAGTIIMGNRGNRGTAAATGILSFNSGIVDATFINMATNQSGGSASDATLSVGNSGVLKVGTGGISMLNEAGTAGTSSLIVTNGASVICTNSIYKGSAIGITTITIANGSSLTLASGTSTIGSAAGTDPIDNFNVTNSTFTLAAIGIGLPDVAVANFNPDTATTNTINIGFLPGITSYPTQIPIISYISAGGNLSGETSGMTNIVLGTLPNLFIGYLSNNIANSSIDLVLTSGPAAKSDIWTGAVNDLWDTTTFNWSSGGLATNYNDLDQITFDDTSHTGTVSLAAARTPATVNGLTFNNNKTNYVLIGTGKITGPVQLLMQGTAATTLSEGGGDNFSGGVQVNSGTLILDDTNSAISGGLTINGGTAQIGNNDGNGALPGGAISDGGTLVFDRTNNLTLSTAVSGAGNLTQNGSATLTVSVVQGYTGVTAVNAGTLAVTGSGAIANSSGVIVSNATLDVSAVTGNSTLTTLQNLNLTNAILIVEAGYNQTNLNITGNFNLGGPTNVINVKSLPAIAHYPATITLINSANSIVGYNFLGLGTLPAATPAYAGSISEMGNTVVLTLTTGPISTRPSVTWSGSDAINTGNTNWSDALNWLTPGVPTASEPVFFNDTDTAGGSPFNNLGDGIGGIVNPGNIDNYVDQNFTNTALNYGNDSGSYHNTQIAPGKSLTINGSVTVNGSGGNDSILGAGGKLQINDLANNNTIDVTPNSILDMSGLDTLNANINQMIIGDNATIASAQWYLARTNIITTGNGFSGQSAAWVIGGSGSESSAGNAQVYLGQTNAIYVDGITMGIGMSVGDTLTFNPNLINPSVYIRGVTGPSSRVTLWNLGDDTLTLDANNPGYNQTVDFSAGTLDARVGTLNVGMGSHSNNTTPGTTGTFNMGLGNLDVTALNVGIFGVGAGNGIGIMNVTGGSVEAANPVVLGANAGGSQGYLNLTNATLVANEGIDSTTNAFGYITETNSLINFGSGTIGTNLAPINTLNLSGGTLEFNVVNSGPTYNTNIFVTTFNTNGPATRIQISSLTGVAAGNMYPLIMYNTSFTTSDPYPNLSLAPLPAGYAGTLVDDSTDGVVDLQLTTVPPAGRPVITAFGVSGHTLTISATNGADGGMYSVYQTTNLVPPITWTLVFTNSFDGSGNINNFSTNVVNPATPDEFYLIEEP